MGKTELPLKFSVFRRSFYGERWRGAGQAAEAREITVRVGRQDKKESGP